MPWYSVNTSITIQSLRTSTPGVKQVWLADDSAADGQIVQFYNWYNHLSQEGKRYCYLVNGSKSWLIVKSDVLADEAKRVFGDEVNITSELQRHLGAVIGSQEFKDQYCREKVLGWKGELEALSQIARVQPQAASIVFTKGYKFTYFMRTTESFEDCVDPIEEATDDLLLPTLLGQTAPLHSDLCRPVTLTPAKRGLGIPDLRFKAPQQFAASTGVNNSIARRFYYHTEYVWHETVWPSG